MVTVVGEAFGKVILMGEHAVVYGHPALAAQVRLPLRMTLERLGGGPPPGGRWSLHCAFPGLSAQPQVLVIPQEEALVSELGSVGGVGALPRALGRCFRIAPPPAGDYRLSLTSELPMGKGMGSSAALAAALLRALTFLEDGPPSPEILAGWVNDVEGIFHGTPSGVDACVVSHGGVVRFRRGPPLELETLRLPRPLPVVLGDSGGVGETKRLVGAVRALREADPSGVAGIFSRIEALTLGGLGAISRGDLEALGPMMSENHGLLARLGVSTPILDEMVDAALSAGALGAKLTGAGGGGLMMALVEDDAAGERVAAALSARGFTTWRTLLGL